MNRVVDTVRDLGSLILEDPVEAKDEIVFRCQLFLEPPQMAGSMCSQGCCGEVYIHEDADEKLLVMVERTAAEIREEEFDTGTQDRSIA